MKGLVRSRLSSFVATHLPSTDLDSDVDEVLIDYLVGVLSEMPEESDDFDVEEFCEMMSAYVIGFEEINRDTVFQWVFDTASAIVHKDDAVDEPDVVSADPSEVDTVPVPDTSSVRAFSCDEDMSATNHLPKERDDGETPRPDSVDSSECDSGMTTTVDLHLASAVHVQAIKTETESTPGPSISSSEENAEDLALLQDMFPDQSAQLLRAILERCGGVMEDAVGQLLADAADTLQVQVSTIFSTVVTISFFFFFLFFFLFFFCFGKDRSAPSEKQRLESL